MRRFRHEPVLYFIAFILALTVRVIKLGALPLTDLEARWALQALGVAQGTQPSLGSQPAYILLTSVIFYAYGGGTNFLARLIPTLTGSALALVPPLFAERLKPRPALILSFLLALDPGLVALSRQAGSPILALTFFLLAWGLWQRKRRSWAGVFAGLALLSGPSLWAGLLTLGLAWAIDWGLRRKSQTEPAAGPVSAGSTRNDWLTSLWFALGTIVIAGTLFFLSPDGLSAWVSALPEYLSGWIHPSAISGGLVLFSLVAYQPLGLILAIVAALRGWLQGSLRVRRLSIWMLVAVLLALLYPGRQVSDLIWLLVPLWGLAALELARALNVRTEERGEVLGVIALCVLLLVFIWLDFLALSQAAASDQVVLRTWLMFGSFFLLIVSLLLVAVGWSIRVARFGVIWGITAFLGVYSFGAMVGAAGLRNPVAPFDAVEMWSPGSRPAEAGLLLATVNQMSDWSDNNINSQPVTIAGIDSPALEWLLHGHAVDMTTALDISASPPIVITTDQNNPRLAANYRGQSFVWRQTPLWNEAQFSDLLSWAAFHQIPENSENIIVWVRGDLFIDSGVPKP